MKRERGRVDWYNSSEGFGSIVSDEFHDALFVHFSFVDHPGGFRELHEGQAVEYVRVDQPGPNGIRPAATQVRPLP